MVEQYRLYKDSVGTGEAVRAWGGVLIIGVRANEVQLYNLQYFKLYCVDT